MINTFSSHRVPITEALHSKDRNTNGTTKYRTIKLTQHATLHWQSHIRLNPCRVPANKLEMLPTVQIVCEIYRFVFFATSHCFCVNWHYSGFTMGRTLELSPVAQYSNRHLPQKSRWDLFDIQKVVWVKERLILKWYTYIEAHQLTFIVRI